jgi:antitoxin MazE
MPRREGIAIARGHSASRDARLLEGLMKVAKWGNSLAVRLPATVVQALRLKDGDEIEIHIAGAREFGVARKPSRQDFLNQLWAYPVGRRGTSIRPGRSECPVIRFAQPADDTAD